MYQKLSAKCIFLFTFFLFLLLPAGEFRIVATADIHGDLRALALLAPEIRRAKPDLLLDAGDLTGGNLVAELDGGSSMIRALNLLKYNFRIPGNHDFDTSQSAFAAQCRLFRGETLGGDWRWGNLQGISWRIVSKGKFKVGVIGLTEPGISRRHLKVDSAPVFIPWQTALENALKKLRSAGVHCTLLLWHNGIDAFPHGVKHALKNVNGIDLVIAAHSHKENPGAMYGSIYIIQPGAYAKSAAMVSIRYNDETLKIEHINSGLLRGVSGVEAPDIKALNKSAVKPWYPKIYSKICRKGDLSYNSFPALGACALREAGGTQGAVFLSSIPRSSSRNAECYRDLFHLMPFHNTLCTVELSRKELAMLLEDLHKNNRKYQRLMGVAGFRWNFKKRCIENFHGNRITLTVSSYLMVSSPVLRRAAHNSSRWQHLGIPERHAVEQFLKKRKGASSGRR